MTRIEEAPLNPHYYTDNTHGHTHLDISSAFLWPWPFIFSTLKALMASITKYRGNLSLSSLKENKYTDADCLFLQ